MQLLSQYLPQDLCKTLIDSYKDRVTTSTVVKSDSTLTKDSTRTSSTYYIPNTDSHIPSVREKVAPFWILMSSKSNAFNSYDICTARNTITIMTTYLANRPISGSIQSLCTWILWLMKKAVQHPFSITWQKCNPKKVSPHGFATRMILVRPLWNPTL